MRMYRVAHFHFKVTVIKLLIFVAAFPTALVWLGWAILRGRESPMEMLAVLNPYHWQEIIGEYVEALAGCRWFIEGAQSRPRALPRYCFYDRESALICCLHLDDAVMLNLKHGGSLTAKPSKKRNNAKQIPAV